MAVVLAIFVALLPLLDPVGLGHLTRLTALLLVLCAGIVAVGSRLARGCRPLFRRGVSVPVALFVAALAVSALASVAPQATWWGAHDRLVGVILYLACTALFVLAVLLVAPAQLQWPIRAWAYGALVAAAYAVVVWAGLSPWHPKDGGLSFDLYGTFNNPDFAASYFGISLPLVAAVTWGRTRRTQARALLAIALIVAALLLTSALTAGVTALAALIPVALLALTRVSAPVRRRLVAVGSVTAIAVLLLVVPGMFDHGPWRGLHGVASVEYRWADWVSAWHIFGEHPLLGVGPGLFGVYFPAARPLDGLALWGWRTWSDAPFSVPLQMLAEGGLVLFTAYAAVVVTVGRKAVRRLRAGAPPPLLLPVVCAWSAYQVQSLISMDVPVLAISHWLLAAFVVVLASADDAAPPWQAIRPQRWAPALVLPAATAAVVLALVPLTTAALLRNGGLAHRLHTTGIDQRIVQFGFPLMPARWDALHRYARTLDEQGRSTEALAVYQQSIAALPRNHWAMLDAAHAAQRLGRWAQADHWFARFIQLEPNATEVILEYAQLRWRAFGDKAGSARLAEQLLTHPMVTQEEYDAAVELCRKLSACRNPVAADFSHLEG